MTVIAGMEKIDIISRVQFEKRLGRWEPGLEGWRSCCGHLGMRESGFLEFECECER